MYFLTFPYKWFGLFFQVLVLPWSLFWFWRPCECSGTCYWYMYCVGWLVNYFSAAAVVFAVSHTWEIPAAIGFFGFTCAFCHWWYFPVAQMNMDTLEYPLERGFLTGRAMYSFRGPGGILTQFGVKDAKHIGFFVLTWSVPLVAASATVIIAYSYMWFLQPAPSMTCEGPMPEADCIIKHGELTAIMDKQGHCCFVADDRADQMKTAAQAMAKFGGMGSALYMGIQVIAKIGIYLYTFEGDYIDRARNPPMNRIQWGIEVEVHEETQLAAVS